MRYTRYTKCTRCTRYTRCTRCMKCMKKYKTDGKYPSQYGFYSKTRSRQLVRDLSRCTLSRPVSPLIPSTHDSLTYDKANSSTLEATTSCGVHGQLFFISTWLFPAMWLLTCVDNHLYGLSKWWKYFSLRYLSEIVYLSRYAVVILNCHSKWQGS